jgi:hypothetical protein
MVIVGVIGYFTYKYLVDPFRTLEPFEMDKYMSDYHSLKGNKYKAELKVANDLGWTMDTGRIMVFTVGNDDRRLPVLIPPKVGENLYFTKGQTYQAILEVGDGGLVNADICQKE